MSIDELATGFKLLAHLFDDEEDVTENYLKNIDKILKFNNQSSVSALDFLAPGCDDMIKKCKLKIYFCLRLLLLLFGYKVLHLPTKYFTFSRLLAWNSSSMRFVVSNHMDS